MRASINIEDHEVGYNIPAAIGMDEADIQTSLISPYHGTELVDQLAPVKRLRSPSCHLTQTSSLPMHCAKP